MKQQVLDIDGLAVAHALAFREDENQAKVDGHLIAAAPDLLAACEEVAGHWAAFARLDLSTQSRLRSAIRKAKGETP